MNYIELFANGGLTKSEKSEGEQRAMQLLESLQELTGVDPKHAAEILNQFKDDPETVNSIQEYVNLAIDPKSDENTRSNAISELTKIFNPSMFKCGGKLQQLVTKFGKGGSVDCGCGGIKLDMGGPVKDGEYTRSDFFNELNEWTPVKLPNGDSGYARNYRKPLFRFGPSSNTLTQMLVTYDENGTPRASSREIKGFFNPNRVKLDTTYNTANNTSASKDFINRMNFALEGVAPERPQSKQEGGSIELTQLPGHDVNTTLTRRQARQLAMDKGRYANNAQFQTAMANAMNTARSMGLRGAEARQRAMEMVAGVSPAERTVTIADPPVADINTFDFNKAKEIPDYIEETGAIRKFGKPTAIIEPKFAGLETQQLLDSLLDKTNTGLTRSLNASGQQESESLVDKLNALFNKKDNSVESDTVSKTPINQTESINSNPVSITSKEINNSGYYRPSKEELERRQQRWNNYWNRPINRPQYQAIDETYEVTPGYAKTDYTLMLNEYLNRPASNWGYQSVDESQNTPGYYNSSISNLDMAARRAERQLARAKRTEISNFNQWNTWHGVNGVAETEIPTYKYGKVELTDEGYRYVPYQKQGGQIEKDITKTLKCGGKTKKK